LGNNKKKNKKTSIGLEIFLLKYSLCVLILEYKQKRRVNSWIDVITSLRKNKNNPLYTKKKNGMKL